MGLRRLRDLTKPENTRVAILSRGQTRSGNGEGLSGLVYTGMLFAVFLLLAMPGVGDALGTAPKIESAVMWLWTGFGDIVRGVR